MPSLLKPKGSFVTVSIGVAVMTGHKGDEWPDLLFPLIIKCSCYILMLNLRMSLELIQSLWTVQEKYLLCRVLMPSILAPVQELTAVVLNRCWSDSWIPFIRANITDV